MIYNMPILTEGLRFDYFWSKFLAAIQIWPKIGTPKIFYMTFSFINVFYSLLSFTWDITWPYLWKVWSFIIFGLNMAVNSYLAKNIGVRNILGDFSFTNAIYSPLAFIWCITWLYLWRITSFTFFWSGFGGHFVKNNPLNGRIEVGRRNIWIRHGKISLKSQVADFYSNLPTEMLSSDILKLHNQPKTLKLH